MKVIDYLRDKYKVEVPTTISKIEAKAFAIPYPLQNGWLKRYGDREIPVHVFDNLGSALESRYARQKRRGRKNAHLTKSAIRIVSSILTTRKAAIRRAVSDDFLASYEWRKLRMVAIKKYGARCQCCGASPADGIVIHVDHIKPRRLYPELALSLDNLQVLCSVCNHGKGNWDETDWRPEEQELDIAAMNHLRSIK